MSNRQQPTYRGVYCPVFTPFTTTGELDLDGAGIIYDHLIAGGVDGIVILGSMGEFQAIPPADRQRLIRFARSHVGDRCRLIVGTGGTAVSEVVELTQFAEEAGADAAMIVPPYYAPVTEPAVRAYYQAVLAETGIDVLLYNFPARTGYDLSPRVVGELARSNERIVGLKDTVDSISHTRAVINEVVPHRPEFAVFSGFDEYIFVNLLSGGAGMVNGLTNLIPGTFRRAYDAYHAGDLETMREIQAMLVKLMPLYTVAPNFVAAFKYAISLLLPGVQPPCAPPEPPLSPELQPVVRELLSDAGLSW